MHLLAPISALLTTVLATLTPPPTPLTLLLYDNWACADRHPLTVHVAPNTCYAMQGVHAISVYARDETLGDDACTYLTPPPCLRV